MFSVYAKELVTFKRDRMNFLVLLIIAIPFLIKQLISPGTIEQTMLFMTVLYTSQIAGKFFATETSEKTMETLISTPLHFRQILFGKYFAMLSVMLLPWLIIFITNIIYYLTKGIFTYDVITSSIKSTLFVEVNLLLIAMIALVISFRSISPIECSMKAPIALTFASIPYFVFSQVLLEVSSEYTIYVYITYVIICAIGTLLFFLFINMYSPKNRILKMLAKLRG